MAPLMIGMVGLELPYPNINPVALQLGPLAIKWYGLAYLTGLLFGWLYIRRLLREPWLWADDKPPFEPAKVDDLLLYITAGVVLGGRLGFVLFYEPSYYLSNPQDIYKVWLGGMSFHGALVGCIIAVWAFARRNGVNSWSTMDLGAASVPIGLFFGRIANFINGELWGRPTDVPWAMVFPHGGPIPRHPSQLYEAALEGVVLFIVVGLLVRCGALKRPGIVTGVFAIGYGVARITCEFFREPDAQLGFLWGGLTMGMLLCIPLIFGGIAILVVAFRRLPKPKNG